MATAVAALAINGVATAAVEQGSTPAIGVQSSAAIGQEIWQEYRFEGQPGVIISQSVQANWGTVEIVDLPAGSPLVVIRAKKLKACASSQVIFGQLTWEDCLIDADDDGRFEKVSFNNVGGSKPIEPPVAYQRASVEIKGDKRAGGGNNFKKQIIYLGSTTGTLRLSYREYANDMARPAFTEELTIPLGAAFPQGIAIKDHVFSLTGLDGMGLHYTLVK